MQEFLETHRVTDRLESMRGELEQLASVYDARAEADDGEMIEAEANPVFSVEVGPVPVSTSVQHFAPVMSPECWSRFASGISVEMKERTTMEPGGWVGYGHELLKPISGDGHLARLLTVDNLMNFHVIEPSVGEPDQADVNFSLRKSLDGVVTVDEGFFRARGYKFLGLNWTHIYGKKSVQLRVPTPAWFNAMVPGILRSILRLWLWEYSARFMLDSMGTDEAAHESGDHAELVLSHAFHSFENEFGTAISGIKHHVDHHARAER